MINGSKKENVFKVIRPQKDKFVDGDTSYFNSKDTCCIHWVDAKNKEYKNGKLGNHTCITKKGKKDKYCKETLDEIKQPYTANIAFIWMFMALLATLMVLVDFFRAMYEKCGVSEWINVTLQARMADPVKSRAVIPVTDDIVKQKTGEIIDKKSGQGAKRLLDVGGMILGFIVYFFMAFPLNQCCHGDPDNTRSVIARWGTATAFGSANSNSHTSEDVHK